MPADWCHFAIEQQNATGLGLKASGVFCCLQWGNCGIVNTGKKKIAAVPGNRGAVSVIETYVNALGYSNRR